MKAKIKVGYHVGLLISTFKVMSFIRHFEQELARLPASIKTIVEPSFRHYCEQFDESALNFPDNPEFLASVIKVWGCSQFVATQCIRHPQMLNDLVLSSDLFAAKDQSYYCDSLSAFSISSETELMLALRQFRRREMVRIAWRDLAAWAELEETLNELSWLAEVCVSQSLDYLYQDACSQYGTPVLSDGSPQQLVVLGMGKLGAWELNFSSDIDLIFAYVEDGVLANHKQTSYSQFFTKLAQRLVKVIDQNTADGFVFRVDTRLRPFGDSGPLVMSFDGMENYYLTQAREWERYAMIKARQIAGDFKAGNQLFKMLHQFVYRRYLDYGAFEELRSLKFKISESLKRQDNQDNIKLGAGGIREIEFIGQAFQLIRGGREPALRQWQILKVLDTLASLQLMDTEEVKQLQEGYCFLRLVENHLQQFQDQQTHDLPSDLAQQKILAYAMNYDDWQTFKTDLDAIRKQIQLIFEQVFTLSNDCSEQSKGLAIWVGESDQQIIIDNLTQLGFQAPTKIQQLIDGFRNSVAIGRLSSKGAEILNRLMPQLFEQVAKIDNPEPTLTRILTLFEQVSGRNVYLALLAEKPGALAQLIKLSSASDWICQYLGRHPILFDELLDSRTLYEPLSRQGLSAQLALQLQAVDVQDVEQLMIELREFKQINVLKVAATDIMDVIPIMVVSDYLTIIAEVLLEQIVQRTWRLLVEKHGAPSGTEDQAQGFGVIGMGKLGGFELGYGSDLDMVFLYDCDDGNAMTSGAKPISCAQFYGRLGQRVMTLINTRMLSGILYEVDMRLRPNGNSGLLVSYIGVYQEYLKNQAWTWEHQALVRGRFIAGDTAIKQEFDQIREQILRLPRDREVLKTEVREMREKMRDNLVITDSAQFDLKQSIGGIADIEFIVQFMVLANAQHNQQLVQFTDTIRILESLQSQDLISEHDAQILKQAYCHYRDRGHRQTLQGEKVIVEAQDFIELSRQVQTIWQKIMVN